MIENSAVIVVKSDPVMYGVYILLGLSYLMHWSQTRATFWRSVSCFRWYIFFRNPLTLHFLFASCENKSRLRAPQTTDQAIGSLSLWLVGVGSKKAQQGLGRGHSAPLPDPPVLGLARGGSFGTSPSPSPMWHRQSM